MRILALILLLYSFQNVYSQEFNLQVSVNIPALKVADPKTLKTLESEINKFINQTKWTDDEWQPEERIEGSLQINIKDDPSANSFLADFYFNAGRPVYNSSYSSPIINHVEKDIRFTYEELTPLRDSRTTFTDELSAILTYYVYTLLGFDGDTFASLGGDDYFKMASEIVNSAPPSASIGWTRSGADGNRFWLSQNIFDPRVRRMRIAMYDYHRNGIDRLYDDVSTAKAVILSSVKEVGRVSETYKNALIVRMWSNAKNTEILEVFKNSVKSEQRQVYAIMETINPSQLDVLRELR